MTATSNKKKLSLAYLNTLTFSCVQMVLYTTIPYISDQTGVLTANIIGAISIGSFIFAFMGPYWATKSDHLGRKKVLGFGMLGMTLSFMLLSAIFIFNNELSLMTKIVMVYLARIIYGFLCSAIVPVSQAWQLDLIEKTSRIKILTRNSMCLNLGRILGPILILAKQVNFEYVIYSAATWVFVLSIFNFIAVSDNKVLMQKPAEKFNWKEIKDNWKKSIHESLMPILLAMIFTAFVGVLHSFLGHHLKVVLNISGQEATIMFAKIVLALSVLAILFQQLSIQIFKAAWKPRVLIGAVSMIIGTVLMMESNSELNIWISIGFIAIATAFIPPAYLALTSHSKENNVFGKKLGLASIAHSFGYALGMGLIAISMKLHLVSESFVVFLISFSILLLSILMVIRIKTKEERVHV